MDYFYASAWQGVAPGLQDAQLGVQLQDIQAGEYATELSLFLLLLPSWMYVKKGLGSEMDYQLDWNVDEGREAFCRLLHYAGYEVYGRGERRRP